MNTVLWNARGYIIERGERVAYVFARDGRNPRRFFGVLTEGHPYRGFSPEEPLRDPCWLEIFSGMYVEAVRPIEVYVDGLVMPEAQPQAVIPPEPELPDGWPDYLEA